MSMLHIAHNWSRKQIYKNIKMPVGRSFYEERMSFSAGQTKTQKDWI